MDNNELTEEDAAIIKGMSERGDEQHNIAAWFGINHGRISEIVNGKQNIGEKFKHIEASKENLPPPGPYTSGQSQARTQKLLKELKENVTELITKMENELLHSDATIKENYERVENNRKNKVKNKKKAEAKKKLHESMAEMGKLFGDSGDMTQIL